MKFKSELIGIAVAACFTLALAACGSVLPSLGNPQSDLNAADAGVAALLAAYQGICTADTSASICSPANQAKAQQAEQAITAAINVAQAAINTSNNVSSAQIQTDIQAVISAVTTFENLVADMKAQAKARGLKLPASVR